MSWKVLSSNISSTSLKWNVALQFLEYQVRRQELNGYLFFKNIGMKFIIYSQPSDIIQQGHNTHLTQRWCTLWILTIVEITRKMEKKPDFQILLFFSHFIIIMMTINKEILMNKLMLPYSIWSWAHSHSDDPGSPGPRLSTKYCHAWSRNKYWESLKNIKGEETVNCKVCATQL